jgi:TolA-binding protein
LSGVTVAVDSFVAANRTNALAGDVSLRLAAAQQATGSIAPATARLQRIAADFPRTPIAARASLALAQLAAVKSPADVGNMEKLLLSIVARDSAAAEDEHKQASFLLADLYARTGRHEQAIAFLEAYASRYANDARAMEISFLLAECHRDIVPTTERLASASVADGPAGAADITASRKDHLLKAKRLFDEVIGRDGSSNLREADRNFIKVAHFHRADCVYELGAYADAIPLYEAAAKRYEGDSSALAAHVQIVNSYCALGNRKEAKTANERAKALVAKLPADALANDGLKMPKAYWEQWLKWTSVADAW